MQRPSFSPDRKRLSVSLADPSSGNADIWIYEVERGLRSHFTFDPGAETGSVWSPDGGTIVFDSDRKGPGDLYRKKANGNSAEELLYADDRRKVPTSWSPDGRFLLYLAADPKTGLDIWVLPDPLGAPGAAKPYPFLQTRFIETLAQFSPDGRWVAYHSNESGRNEVYVAPFPGPGGKQQISTAGGQYVRWRQDGKEIFYVNLGGQLMAREVSVKNDELAVGRTTGPIFGAIKIGPGTTFDVTADGKRFLAIVPPEQGSSAPLTLVQNWPAALRR
jgi:Tol biopolymer transport system component